MPFNSSEERERGRERRRCWRERERDWDWEKTISFRHNIFSSFSLIGLNYMTVTPGPVTIVRRHGGHELITLNRMLLGVSDDLLIWKICSLIRKKKCLFSNTHYLLQVLNKMPENMIGTHYLFIPLLSNAGACLGRVKMCTGLGVGRHGISYWLKIRLACGLGRKSLSFNFFTGI